MIIHLKQMTGFRLASLGAIFCLVAFTIGAVADCGFGNILGSKIEAVLNRWKPPEVYLLGTTISVNARAQVNEARNYAAPLATQLESALINNDRRLSIEHAKPETVISCIITSLTSSEKMENRTTTEHKKVGEQQVYNDKKKKFETKDVFKDVDVTKAYKVISSAMNVSYQVRDVKSNTQLIADNIPATFNNSYQDGNGAPTLQAAEQMLIGHVVAMITPRLTPTTEPVKVLLPRCELGAASDFGKSGLWQRMRETLENMPALKKPKDDAYRYYGIGLANEALAYKAAGENIETTRKLLDDAAENYSKAIDMKPEEKYFREPQTRINTAITQYTKITEQRAEYAKVLKSKTLEKQKQETPKETGGKEIPVQPPKNKGPATANTTVTNQGIINLVKKETSDMLILQIIKGAPSVQFDLSAEGIGDLKDNKVSEPVIMAMMEKQNSASPAAPKKPPVRGPRKAKP